MISDPISDMLTRIKNSYMARKKTALVPLSKFARNLAGIMEKEDYIGSFSEDEKNRCLKIMLKYHGETPALENAVRVSKPGLRIYKGKNELPRVLGGLGIAIVSTTQGLMTVKDAKKRGLGGEVICKLW